MSHKSPKIAAEIAGLHGQHFDPHYLGYFVCFNQGRFYEAHDVLEELWLPCRKGPKDLFYKGLIQLAGAYVHLQKNRLGPALALLRLAQKNLSLYGDCFEGLNLRSVLADILSWSEDLVARPDLNPLLTRGAPTLQLPVEVPLF